MKVILDKDSEYVTEVTPKDQCFDCTNSGDCPLIFALNKELVVLRYESISVKNCGFYSVEKNLLIGNKRNNWFKWFK